MRNSNASLALNGPPTQRKPFVRQGESYGFSPEELGGIQDPRVVKVLLDAQKWQALKAKQPEVQSGSQAPKLAKPRRQGKTNAKAQLRSQLKKDGSWQARQRTWKATLRR